MALTRALVVDDSRLARVALSKLLGRRGIEVDVAGSGEEALEYLRTQAPDVVFLDYMMPDMDGMEAARAIQALPERDPLPLVMYTSQDTDDDRLRAHELGVCGFLPKPTSEDALDAVLADVEAWSPPPMEASAADAPATADTSAEQASAPVPAPSPVPEAEPAPAEPARGGAVPDAAELEQRAGEVAAAVARETLDTQLDEARVHWQHELDRVGAELQEMLQESMQQARREDDTVGAARAAAEESAQAAVNEVADGLRQQAEEAARQAAVKAVEQALAERDAPQQDAALEERVNALLAERLEAVGETEAFREQLVTALTDHGVPVLKNALDQWVRELAAQAALDAVEDALRSASEVMFKEAAAAAAEAAAEEANAAHARTRRFMLLACTVLAAGVVTALILAV
ncbi:response regulator [Aquisalimonas asiatica]|uniref:Response regulator receiver domain-containing protein n=1 Tax=Aquisalimonas asiatica TaxID=406100 RepID=A0A1H8VEX0_9GAMM|nr:response regulator [Aquisalimonas asiatica]SEP13959.1 Response regulator receiver domain-containing protein [Aquisalimonas asiatica]